MEHINRLDIRDIALGRRSTEVAPWRVVAVRPLVREDMILLVNPASPDPKAPLARISAPHHLLARLIAEGKEPVDVSAITGYSTGRIRTLQSDPAFCELVAHYETGVVQAVADVQAQITHIALAAAQRLQEKLDDESEKFTTKELREISTAMLDRAGHGPTSKSVLTVNDPSQVIAKLHSMIQTESRGRVFTREAVDVEFTETINVTPAPSEGLEESDARNEGPLAGDHQIEGPSGGGDTVSEQSPA